MLNWQPKQKDPPVVWQPFPGGQTKFLSCPVYECLFEGNRGPGKTDALLMDFAQFVGIGWGEAWRGILFRETYPNLKDVIAKSQKWFRKIFPDAVYNSTDHAWRFKTGEVLYFRHARTVDDYWSYHGHEYPWVGWEELTNWATPDLYLMMVSVCRSSDPRVTVRHYRSTANPWGRGHNWVKNRFIDRGKPGDIIQERIDAKEMAEFGVEMKEDMIVERTYVHGDRKENEALMKADPNYVFNLARNASESIRKAWIAGDWDVIAGGMFDDLWNPKKHILKPFNIPRSWKVYRSFDWGLSAPFSVGWWAQSDGTACIVNGKVKYYPRGTLFRIDEWYGWQKGKPNKGLRLTNIQLGRGIKKREEQIKKKYDIVKIHKGPADASIFGDESDADSIASKISKSYYAKETKAMIFVPSNKKPGTRVMRWQLIRDRLEAVVNDDMESPQLYCFDTCQEGFIRTIRILPRDEKNPDDIDTEAEDHALDETAYMVLHVSTTSQMKRATYA